MKHPSLKNLVVIVLYLHNVQGELFGNENPSYNQDIDTNLFGDYDPENYLDQTLEPTPMQAPPCLPDCQCSISSLICDVPDTFHGFDNFDNLNHILTITIRNQVTMTHFNLDHLKLFPNLRSLEISNSSLQWLTGKDSFCNHPALQVNLSNNQLSTLHWRAMGYCEDIPVTLAGNPLICNCSLFHLNFFQPQKLRGVFCKESEGNMVSVRSFLQKNFCEMPIAKIKLKQNGKYEFQANSTEDDSFNFEIFNLEPTIQVVCQIISKTPQDIKVSWLRSESGNIEDARVIKTNENYVKIIERKHKSILRIRKADATSNGVWVCSVEDGSYYGHVTLNLTVHSVPIITHFERFQSMEFYTIHYSIEAWPLPNITWVYQNSTTPHPFDDQLLVNNTNLIPESIISDIECVVNKAGSYEIEGSLTIRKFSEKHNGIYILIADNDYGSARAYYYVNATSSQEEIEEQEEYPNKSLPLDDGSQGAMGSNKNKLVSKGTKVLMLFLVCLSMLLIMVVTVLILRKKCCSQKTLKRHHQHLKLNSSSIHPSTDNKNKICILYQNKNYKNNQRKFKETKRKNSMGKLVSFCFTDGQVKHHKELIRLEHVEENPSYDKGVWDHLDLCLLSTVPKISHERIECLQKLGEGAFGLVHFGVMSSKGLEEDGLVYVPVALKTFKENGMKNLHGEASTLMGLSHPNVVALHGVCIDKFPPTLVLEYMPLGDLNKFIRARSPDADLVQTKISSDRYFRYKNINDSNLNKHKFNNDVNNNIHDQANNFDYATKQNKILEQLNQLKNTRNCHSLKRALEQLCQKDDTCNILTQQELLQISLQITQGAAYLASRHFVHRDLATRNCLVGSNMVVKIGDFGMSRDVYSTDYYRVGSEMMMPIRWMPPESIMYRTFTLESDVWSVGVVLWEVFSYGKQPWYELTNTQVVQHLLKGHVMSQPNSCPAGVYQLMKSCWCKQPKERIKMGQLARQLENIAAVKKH